MTLALINSNREFIKQVQENSWCELPNGDIFSPATNNWNNGEYSLEEVQEPDAVPEGKQIVSTEVQMVNDHPKWVHILEDTPIPDRVTSRQFKMQLSIAGLKSSVDGWIATQTELVQIAYEYSGTFVKNEPMMVAGFTALGFTETQINDFFLAASKL